MQKRTFLTDATPVSIDAPVTIKGLIIINATNKDCVVTADNGDTFPAPALVISTWSLPPTSRVRAQLSAAPTNGKACNVIVTDADTLNSTSQLATLSGGSSGTVTRVTALPAAPTDGQQVMLDLNALWPGIEWLCTYNSSTGYWDVIGEALEKESILADAGTASVWVPDNRTQINVPFAGDYHCEADAYYTNTAGVLNAVTSAIDISSAGTPARPYGNSHVPATDNVAVPVSRKLTGLAAHALVTLWWLSASPGPMNLDDRTLKATPIRIQ